MFRFFGFSKTNFSWYNSKQSSLVNHFLSHLLSGFMLWSNSSVHLHTSVSLDILFLLMWCSICLSSWKSPTFSLKLGSAITLGSLHWTFFFSHAAFTYFYQGNNYALPKFLVSELLPGKVVFLIYKYITHVWIFNISWMNKLNECLCWCYYSTLSLCLEGDLHKYKLSILKILQSKRTFRQQTKADKFKVSIQM